MIAGRYHLYVSYACPWAHRTLIARKIKGLEDFIDVTVVSPHMGEHGWPFAKADAFPGAGDDPVMGAEHMKDLYLAVQPDYDGRYAISLIHPCLEWYSLLWHPKVHRTIVV